MQNYCKQTTKTFFEKKKKKKHAQKKNKQQKTESVKSKEISKEIFLQCQNRKNPF